MRKLARKKSHRSSLLRNLATSLILYESVTTTEAKGKELKRFAEKIISRGKLNNISTKRKIYGALFDKNASAKLFSELILRYKDKTSGYITICRTGNRLGDNAPTVRVELINKKVFVETNEEKPAKTVKR